MAENVSKKRLTPKQKRGVAALLKTTSNKEAAKLAKVKERTFYRWLKTPAFREALAKAEAEAMADAIRLLAGLQSKAVGVLQELMEDGESEHARLGAARAILGMNFKLRELHTLEERMANLERRLL